MDNPGLLEHERVRVNIETPGEEEDRWYEPYISKDPSVRQGRPCVAGTGIEVAILVAVAHAHNQTVEEIAREHGIALVFARAAVDYYRDQTDEIDRLIAQDQKEIRTLVARDPADPLVIDLKQLSLTQRGIARALMSLLRTGLRDEVITILKTIQNAKAA